MLSALGVLSILFYLNSTERRAPKLMDSIEQIGSIGMVSLPLVSIIITAKNEEQVIGRCLKSIMDQTYKNLEIVVVDDSSSDKTASIAEELGKSDARILIVAAGEKPRGWAGKSWPCQKGFENSRGETLLFVDADSYFDPKAVELSLGYFQSRSYDMFSISPNVKLRGMWSHAIMPLLAGAINLLYPMSKVNDPKNERAYVFGTFILVKRAVYIAIGGHEKVKDRLVEDAAIAHLAKSSGFKLRVEKGAELASTEWETDFGNLLHGLERVFSDSVKPYGLLAIIDAVVVFFLGIFPLFVIVGYLYLELAAGASYQLLSFASLAIVASSVSIIGLLFTVGNELKQISGKIGPYPFLYPLGCLIFIFAIISASVKISRGGPFEWKGSSYLQQRD